MLEVSNVNSGYGHLQVLWEVSLKVSEGEFLALLGPNGAGKTTLLRTVAGVIQPWAGEVKFMGKQIGDLPVHQITRMGLSFITEDLNLFEGMTVRENLFLGAYIRRDKRIKESLDYVLDLFPVLAERRTQLAGTLSGGERKMLALGRGLMSEPRLLLVDEPSLGLAPKLVLSVFEALQELQRRGVTILLVEQNVSTSLQIVDRGCVLEQGRIVLEGKSADLLGNEHVKEAYLGIGGA
ncbi:MAG: ABC transporter ATP-binding protein [Anaerolineales bacterium]|nr:ABC transporter ATP-binding protein [Anaerolineales bacterium]